MDPPRRKEVDPKAALPVTTLQEASGPVPLLAPIALPEPLSPASPPKVLSEDEFSPYIRAKRLDMERYEADTDDLQFLKTVSGRADAYQEFERIIEAWEDATGKEAAITLETATELISSPLPLREIYDYWLRKRETLQHSLWRKYWKSDIAQDSLIKQTFNQRKAEKMRLRMSKSIEESTYRLFWRVRDDLEEALDLFSCLEARERLKLQSIELTIAQQEQIIGTSLYPPYEHPHRESLLQEAQTLVEESQYLRSDQQYLELLLQPRRVMELVYGKELPTRQLRGELAQSVADLRRSLEEVGI